MTRWGAATNRGYIPERLPTMPHLVFILSLAVPVLNSSLQLSIPSAISYVIDFQTTHTCRRMFLTAVKLTQAAQENVHTCT